MITPSAIPTLFLQLSLKQDKLNISISQQDAPFYQGEEIPFDLSSVRKLCGDVRLLLNQTRQNGQLSKGLSEELKKVGQLLYDQLLTPKVKTRLRNTGNGHLILQMDEKLVFIPWELLHDGSRFLSLSFNIGRRVITRQPLSEYNSRPAQIPLRMLILADPTGDLPAARQEARIIRDKLDCNRDMLAVSAKITDIALDYVRRNMRDYDFIHFAGHTDYQDSDPGLGGWKLSDGHFSAQEIQKMQGGAPFPALVFLNSCQSAQISGITIDGQYEEKCFGLVHAFLTVGIKHFIGTLWKIPDEVGLTFSAEFYHCIRSGTSIGEAVRCSRLKIMEKYGAENIIWTSYVLYGDPQFTYFPRGLTQRTTKVPVRGFPVYRKPKNLLILFLIFCLAGLIYIWYAGQMNQPVRDKRRIRSTHKSVAVVAHFKLLEQVMAQMQHSEQDYAVYVQALAAAKDTQDPSLVAKACYASARKIREQLLTDIVFSPTVDRAAIKQEFSAPYVILLKIYQAAAYYAAQAQNFGLQASALSASAEINLLYGEYELARLQHEKSLQIFAQKKTLSTFDRFAMMNAYIDLTHLYALHYLDFTQAFAALDQMPGLMKDIDAPQGQFREAKQLVLHRYDQMLLRLATSRYANSHFATKAKEMRKALREGLNLAAD